VTAGVIFSLLSAVVLNIGNITEKHAIVSLPEISIRRTGHLLRTLLGSREWMLGFVLCLVGLGLQVLAFSLAPIPVVQSIFNAGIVLLIVVSRLKLSERLEPLEWTGIGIVVVALTLIAVTLGGDEGSIGLVDSGWRVLIALGPTLVVVLVAVVAIRSRLGAGAFLFGLVAGLLYGAAALGTKGASTLVVRHGLWPSIPFVFSSIYPYVFVACSVVGMIAYQTGLQRHRISVVGSMSDAVCSTYLVGVGMIVFGASLPNDPVTLALRFGGFVGVVLGTVLVAAARPMTTESMPPIESDIGLGSVLVAEVDATGHSLDSVSGP
jgi:drug/metabolite transporter (DMT)-like permease